MSTVTKRIERIKDDTTMSGEQKWLEMDRLGQIRIELAKAAEEVRISRRRGE